MQNGDRLRLLPLGPARPAHAFPGGDIGDADIDRNPPSGLVDGDGRGPLLLFPLEAEKFTVAAKREDAVHPAGDDVVDDLPQGLFDHPLLGVDRGDDRRNHAANESWYPW